LEPIIKSNKAVAFVHENSKIKYN